jgi:hypothetical protein
MYTVVSSHGNPMPPVGLAERILLRDLNLHITYIQKKARGFLRDHTPFESGYMMHHIKSWGTRMGSLGGFSFYLGWRASDFGRKPYAKWVNYGTGIFGVHKSPIVPRRAKMLAWESDGGFKRAPFVLGQKPQMMLEKATEDWNMWILKYIERKRVETWRKTL